MHPAPANWQRVLFEKSIPGRPNGPAPPGRSHPLEGRVMRAKTLWAFVAAVLVGILVVMPAVALAPSGTDPDRTNSAKPRPTRKPKPTPTASPTPTPTPTTVTLVGAGGIASSRSSRE